MPQTNNKLIEQVSREAALRGRNALLIEQYNAIHSTLVRYAEVTGKIMALAKPLVERWDFMEAGNVDRSAPDNELETHVAAFADGTRGLLKLAKENKDVDPETAEAAAPSAEQAPGGPPASRGTPAESKDQADGPQTS